MPTDRRTERPRATAKGAASRYVLSRDLAAAVAATDFGGRDLPDDVAAALAVASAGGGATRVSVAADYAFEGEWTPCTEGALWHFNVHPEHLYDLHAGEPSTDWRALEVDVDGAAAAVAFDAGSADAGDVAAAFARDHGLLGLGCPPGDGDGACVAAALAAALAASPRARAPRCPVARFCCG